MDRDRFRDKVVVVTGAGSGLGREIALAFAGEGAKVALADINEPANRESLRLVEQAGGTAIALTSNVAARSSVENLIAKTVDRFGVLDIAINNAAIDQPVAPFLDLTDEIFDRVMSVNLRGIFLCMQAEIRAMLPRGKGAIVNITSLSDQVASTGMPFYGASKHGALGLTRALAVEFAPQGIRINAVSPGAMRTAMNESVRETHPEFFARGLARHPIGRMAELGEVAAAVLFLASDGAGFIVGHSLKVDGGYTAA